MRRFMCAVFVTLCIGPMVFAQEITKPEIDSPKRLDESLVREAALAMRSSVEWLKASQQEDGHWSTDQYPAMTGFAISAIMRSPDMVSPDAQTPDAVKKGLDFLLKNVREDGGIYKDIPGVKGGGLPNYNTAIALSAMKDARDPKLQPTIENARKFLAGLQHKGDDVWAGGMGYDAERMRPYSDNSNTYFAMYAMYATQPPEMGDAKATLDWKALRDYLSRSQHLDSVNDAEWVDMSDANRGGFIYHPRRTRVEPESEDPEKGPHPAYGAMSCVGLLGLLLSDTPRDDPQVVEAMGWLERHWSIDEHPRMGDKSLYYYYLTLSRALDAYGQNTIEVPGKGKVNWRREVTQKLLELQKIDEKGKGYWANDVNRWREGDAVLTTCYAMLALETAVMGDPSLGGYRFEVDKK